MSQEPTLAVPVGRGLAADPRPDAELIAAYVALRHELAARGLLRGDVPLAGGLSEHLAAACFGVELVSNLVNADFDGWRDGLRIQVKGRVLPIGRPTTAWVFHRQPSGFDLLLAFVFDPDYRVLDVIEAPLAVVLARSRRVGASWRFPWTRTVREDPRVLHPPLPGPPWS